MEGEFALKFFSQGPAVELAGRLALPPQRRGNIPWARSFLKIFPDFP